MKELLLLLFLCVPWEAFGAVLCDGLDDRINTTLVETTFISASAYTITGWLNVQSTAAGGSEGYDASPLVGDSGGTLTLGRLTDTLFSAGHFDEGPPWDYAITSASSTGWHHLAQRFSSGTLELFVDGVSVASEGSIPNLFSPTHTLYICDGITNNLGDRVSNIALYNVALSNGEIGSAAKSRLMYYGRTKPTGYWPLNDCADGVSGDAVSFKDRSGNTRDATGDNGGNDTGLTCKLDQILRRPMWVE